MRDEQISSHQLDYRFGSELTQQQALSELDGIRSQHASNIETAKLVNDLVNRSISHRWTGLIPEESSIRVPIEENYILWWKGREAKYRHWEFSNWKLALERGIGLCSQHAIVVAGILGELGIKTKIVDLSGHVVCLVFNDTNADWYVSDADYGVFMEIPFDYIEANPDTIADSYELCGYPKNMVNTLVDIYGEEGNEVSESIQAYKGEYYDMEKSAYLWIWLLPGILLIGGVGLLRLTTKLATP